MTALGSAAVITETPDPSVLTTDRLVLRPFAFADLDEYTMISRHPAITAHLPGGSWRQDEVPIRCAYALKRYIDHTTEHGFGPMAVTLKATGGLLGHCGLRYLPPEIPPVNRPDAAPDEGREVELLYMLGKPYWRRGIALEAARVCLGHGFGTLGVKRVSAVVLPNNKPSISLAQKLGMREEGPRRAFGLEMMGFTITRDEFVGGAPKDSASG